MQFGVRRYFGSLCSAACLMPPIIQNFYLGEIKPLRHGFAVPPPLKWRQYVLCIFTVDSIKIGFSLRRSCHEVTDEVKYHGLVLPAAVCGHTAIQVGSRRNYRKIHIYKRQKTTALHSLRRSLLRAQIITCISHCFVR